MASLSPSAAIEAKSGSFRSIASRARPMRYSPFCLLRPNVRSAIGIRARDRGRGGERPHRSRSDRSQREFRRPARCGSAHAFQRSAKRAGPRPHSQTLRTPSRSAPVSSRAADPPISAIACRRARAGRSPIDHARGPSIFDTIAAASAFTARGRVAEIRTSISGCAPCRVCVTVIATGALPITSTRLQTPSSNRSTTLCGRRRSAHTVRSSRNGGRGRRVNVSAGTR